MKSRSILYTLCLMLLLSSCLDKPEKMTNNYRNNFESLWRIIDTQYCFLDEKKINWDSIYTVYNARLGTDTVSELAFFDAMGEMLAELRDGHVNLYSSFDRSRYWKWFTDYPSNFSSALITSYRYLSVNFRQAGGLRYQRIAGDSVGYIYYSSFSDSFSNTNMSYILKYFEECRGIIIDVRSNGGGYASLSEQLASYFFPRDTVSIYMRHKTGPGHSDFSEPVALPTKAGKIQYTRPVVVLANRGSYSATNMFITRMKDAPNATILGDLSGGGGGLPASNELPNGWMVRFSSSPMFDGRMQHIEFGIEPDIKVMLDPNDVAKGEDTLIEAAVAFIGTK
ncbi:MAG: S41 family peptidase [Paludibacter sp.]|nr:S41 family peptidase [Paludibacter sp.]